MACGHGPCAVTMIAFALGWLLLASTLVWLSWNRVIAQLTKVKQLRFWQPMLVIATVAVLVGPWCAMKGKRHCGDHHGCEKSENCPYDAKDKKDAAAPTK